MAKAWKTFFGGSVISKHDCMLLFYSVLFFCTAAHFTSVFAPGTSLTLTGTVLLPRLYRSDDFFDIFDMILIHPGLHFIKDP